MHFRIVCLFKLMSVVRFGLSFTHDVFDLCTSHVHAFFMDTFFLFFPILSMCCVLSFLSFSLSRIEPLYGTQTEKIHSGLEPSSWFQVILFWSTYSISHPVPWWKPKKDFFENFKTVVVIRNARSFYRISLTLLYPKSFKLVDGNPFMGNSRDAWSTSAPSIPLCLNLLRHSEVHVS